MSEQDIQRYEKMLAEDPNSRAFAPLANAYRKAGKLDDAIRVAESGVRRHPHYSGGLVVLGRALMEAGEMAKAAEIMERAVAEAPENYLAQKTMGRIAKARGDNQRALTAMKAAHLLSPEDMEIEGELKALEGRAYRADGLEFAPPPSEADEKRAAEAPGEQKEPTLAGVGLAGGGGPDAAQAEESPLIEPLDAEREGGLPEHLEPLREGIGADLDEEDIESFYSQKAVASEPSGTDIPEFIQELSSVAAQKELSGPSGTESLVSTLADEGVKEEDVTEISAETQLQEEESPPSRETDLPQPTDAGEDKGITLPEGEQRAEDRTPAFPPPEAVADVIPPPPREPVAGQSVDQDGIPTETDGIPTETLGDLYAQQGLTEKASHIYQQLLKENPADKGLIEKLRSLSASGGATGPIPGPEEPISQEAADPVEILQEWLRNVERMRRR